MTRTTTHDIQRTDGTALAVWTTGPVDGTPVVFCHPAPGSGRFDPDPDHSVTSGLRIIAPDRQGYGASQRSESVPTIARAGEDLLLALDHFDIESAPVLGWSAGGRVAMWLAAHHPGRVRELVLAGTPAPHDAVAWIPDEQVAMIEAMRPDRGAAVDQMAAMFASIPTEGRVSMVAPTPADQMLLADEPDLALRLDRMLDTAFDSGPTGMAADIASYTLGAWGFDPESISVPTTIFTGSDDFIVPPPHGSWYAGRIATAKHEVVAGAGHLVVVEAWRRSFRG